jgi:hypothetical protein
MDDFRYDVVWRRIRRDEYAKKLEGRFQFRYDRLAKLVNWGALSWLYTHATASKQAHHLGVEHNAMRFLAANPSTRSRHRPSLRTAAHVLHWGHPPLSYQSAEALLRAAHVQPEIKSVLESVIQEVVDFGSLKCQHEQHEGRCASAILNGERPFELYRWLSAWAVKDDWKRLWEAIVDAENAAGGKEPDADKVKTALIHSLVCHDDPGFQILSHCNEADYVPRDLLQCGTAWLSLDLDVLWESDPIGPDAADEWALLDSARGYLEGRFYSTPMALLLHSLTARILANSLVSRNFDVEALRSLLRADQGDDFYEKDLTPHYKDPYLHLKSTANSRLETDWWHIGTFENVSVPEGTRFDAEDFLIDRSGRNRLSFPFSEGHSVFVDLQDNASGVPDFSGPARQYGAVYCDFRGVGKPPKARPMLNVLAKCEDWIQRSSMRQVGNALMSWFLNERITQVTKSVDAVAEEIFNDNEQRFVDAISELRKRKSFVELHEHGDVAFRSELLVDTGFRLQMLGAGFFLTLPWRGMRLAPGKELLRFIRTDAIRRASEGTGGQRGAALELAVVADQLLSPDEAEHRFLILNATQWSATRRPTREWDVIRVDLRPDGAWAVIATECAVNRSNSKDKEAETKLEILQKALKGSFSDFASYATYLATVTNGSLDYEDAGRSYNSSR